MDADGLCAALLELATTSQFAPPGSCWRLPTLTMIPEHRRRRLVTLRMRKAMGDLFLGPYRR
jgi:hypothetical protein